MTNNEADMLSHINDLTDKLDTATLALQAIADMHTDNTTNWQEIAMLCVTIARVTLANDYDSMLAAIPT